MHDIASDEEGFGDVRRVVIRVGGAAVHVENWRTSDSRRVITFEIDTTEAANIARNHASAASLNVEIEFQNASNTALFNRHFTIVATSNDPEEVPPQTLASATAITWDVDKGAVADLTLGHNTTLTLSNGYNGEIALLRALQDSTGSRTLTLASAIQRGGRDAPTLRTAGGERDFLMFNKIGTVWYYLGIISDA